MTKNEFERIYCLNCEMCADCTAGCPPYHEAEDDKVDVMGDINRIANLIIDLNRAMTEASFHVFSVRIAKGDTTVHIESTGIVEQLSEALGVELYQNEDSAYIYYAGIKIVALYW